jgi:alpha-amylase
MNQTGIVPMVDLVINHMTGGWGGGGRYNYDCYHDTFEKRDTTGNNSSNYFNTAGSFAPFQVDLGYGDNSGDINHRHPYMRQGLKTWGAWLSAKVGYRAYRWDVAYHIDPWFISEFMNYGPMKGKFAVMEGWSLESGFSIKEMETYVALTDHRAAMFDMPLAEKLRLMCNLPASFDMESLNGGAFASIRPEKAVTFVESHDTIRSGGEDDKFGITAKKELAYAFILLSEGLPCIFYHDYFDPPYVDISTGWSGTPLKDKIDPLIAARKAYAAGGTEYLSTSNKQHLYIARRTGDGQKPGCILVINNHTTSGLTNTVNVSGFYTNGTVLIDALNTNHSITVSGGVANIGASNRSYRLYVKQ